MSHSTSKDSFDLIITFIEAGDLSEAQKAFDEMATLDDHEDSLILRTKASAIIYAYVEYASYLENAQKAFDDRVAALGDCEEDAIERARASVALLSAYRDYDNDRHKENITKVFDDIRALVEDKKRDLGYASYSISLLPAYGNYASHLQNAQKIFDVMVKLGNHEEIALERAKASFSLMMLYMKPITQEINDLQHAKRSFKRAVYYSQEVNGEKRQSIEEFAKEHDKKFGTSSATLSADFISACANYARQVEKAQKVFDAMASLGNHKEIAFLRANASSYLISAYLGSKISTDEKEIKDWQSAEVIYKGMVALGDYKEIAIMRARAICNLIANGGSGGGVEQLQKNQALLDEMATLGAYEEITRMLVNTSSSMITKYYWYGDVEKAQSVFDRMLAEGGLVTLIQNSTCLIHMYCRVGDLQKAQALIDDMEILDDQNEMAGERARGFIYVIDAYREAGDLEKAQAFLERMASLGDDRDIVKERAKSTVNLIADYSNAGDCKKAQALFDGMASLGDHKDIVEARARASANLMSGYGTIGNLKKSQEVFDDMPAHDNNRAVAIERAKASSDLIVDYCNVGDLQKAQEIFDAMSTLCDYDDIIRFGPGYIDSREKIVIARAKASFDLMNAYVKAGDLQKAQTIFAIMATLGDWKVVVMGRGRASFNLIDVYIETGDLQKAQILFDGMVALGDHKEVALERARVSFNLIHAYAKAGDLQKAKNLLNGMAALSDEAKIAIERDVASFNSEKDSWQALATVESLGDSQKAQALLDSMAAPGEHKEIVECRTKAKKLLDEYVQVKDGLKATH